MNFQENTGKTIQQAFDEYHKDNPKVYVHFIRLAMEAIRRGKKKISAKMILNVIRWEVFIETVDSTLFDTGKELKHLKINDAYSSRYGRMFVVDFPQYENHFEFRELRS